jgi:ATP-dependent DNA helicase DinG
MEIKIQISDFFRKGGILDRNSGNFEFRDSQLKMAQAVSDSLGNKSHIIIEAPTGIGKSFAYLVPAIIYAKENNKKAIISTHTINLQEQLIGKDIPFLKKTLPFEFKAALLKGKNNYLCPKRLKKAMDSSDNLFERDEKLFLDKIYSWSKNTTDGTLSDVGFKVDSNVWSSICAETGICSNKTCGGIEDTVCFFQKAKHKIAAADVIILNHHLFFTLYDGSRKDKPEGYLYKNDFLVFDEAHTVEAVAAEHIVPSISREMIKYHLLRLYNDRKKKGALLNFPALHVLPVVQNLLEMNQVFFYELKRKIFKKTKEKYNKLAERIYNKNILTNLLNDEISKLIVCLRELRQFCKTELEENELNDFIIRFGEFNRLINDFIEMKGNDLIYWVELSSQKEDANVKLCASPIDISGYLRQNIFRADNTSILTSATITIDNNFDYFKSRLGAEAAEGIKLPTQFDYYRQVKIYIPNDPLLIPQKETSRIYSDKLAGWISHFLKLTKGKALVLFTNAYLMRETGKLLREMHSGDGIEILIQGENLSRNILLKNFQSDVNSVLLGLDSFWLGVDVPGESLSNLIITRLPFYVPDHPLIQARMEFIEQNGGNSFMDYQLPEAILKFRQGVGRLIRHKSDNGIIVILDNRIIAKQYGKHFLNSIEECPVEIL